MPENVDQHPAVLFRFGTDFSERLLTQLNDHHLDLCLISYREESENFFPLGEEEIVAWLPEGHPLAEYDTVPLRAFETEDYIDIFPGQDIDNARIFAQYQIHPKVTMSAEDSYAVFSLVDAGLGISMNHRSSCSSCSSWKGRVCIRPVEPSIRIPVGIAPHGT